MNLATVCNFQYVSFSGFLQEHFGKLSSNDDFLNLHVLWLNDSLVVINGSCFINNIVKKDVELTRAGIILKSNMQIFYWSQIYI